MSRIQLKITAKIEGHETLLSFSLNRRLAYDWVVANCDSIEQLAIDAGLNHWNWSRTSGWFQIPQVRYDHRGLVAEARKPIPRGNDFYSHHPWMFCMKAPMTPNPLCPALVAAASLF